MKIYIHYTTKKKEPNHFRELSGYLIKMDSDRIIGAELEEELRQIDQALLVLSNFSYWVAFDWNKPETRPTKYGKYFVRRKDGKIHWETWNGSGWAYNGNVITHWMEVKPPCS
jgi:hypothetical protein